MAPSTKIVVSGMKIEQGGRDVFVLTPSVAEMLRIIPPRANPDVIQDANRRLYVPHAKTFGEYLMGYKRDGEAKDQWVCGPFMAGITQAAIREAPRAHEVIIDFDGTVKLFDGQHRRYGFEWAINQANEAIADLQARLAEDTVDDRDAAEAEIEDWTNWITGLLQSRVVIFMYVEEDLAALQQMYADISKVRNPDAGTRTRFDRTDAFNVAALELAETHPALKGYVDMERNTLARTGDSIITINQLAGVVRTLFGGVSGRINEDVEARTIVERGTAFFNDLSKGETFKRIIGGKVRPSEIRESGDISVNVTIMRTEAAIWRELHIVKDAPRRNVVDYLGTLPTKPGVNGLWVKAGILPARLEKATPLGRAQEMREAVKLAVAEYEASTG